MNRVFVAIVLCFSLTTANAQDGSPDEFNAEQAHNELRELKQDVTDAVNSADWEALAGLLSEKVIVTWMDGTSSHGPANVLEYMKSKAEGDTPIVEKFTISVEATELSDFHGPNTATAFGLETSEFVLRGKSMSLTGPWTATVVREGNDWKIAQAHASIGVFDSPLLSWAWRSVWIAAAIAGFIGLLIGWLIGRIRKKAAA